MKNASFSKLAYAVAFFASTLTTASPVAPRNGGGSPRVSTVFQLPNVGSWFENLAIRANGNILATRADVAELWTINPFSGVGAQLTNSFGTTNGCLGISKIGPDVFAVLCGTLDLAKVTGIPGTFSVFKVEFGHSGRHDDPTVSAITAIPQAQFLNGITTFNDDTVLIADSAQGVIYKLNVNTGAYSIALQDATMLPAPGGPDIGVNGVKVFGGYVYYTSTTQEKFVRVRVNGDAKAAGPFEIVATGFPQDDFIFSRAGTPYICTNVQDTVITLNQHEQPVVIAGSNTTLTVAGSTAAEFGRTWSDHNTLYVTTSGGLAAPVNGTVVEPAKVVAIKLYD